VRPSCRYLALLFVALPACIEHTPDDNPPPVDAPPPDVSNGCISPETRARHRLPISGTVVDFVSGAPVAGATVDVTTGWDTRGYVPDPSCPLIASLVTNADGTFGPLTVDAGTIDTPPILLFLVHGGDRAPTSFDSLAPCAYGITACDSLTVSIPAASATLDATWRADLAAGGMPDAATRTLVAFRFKNTDQTGAAGVVPIETFQNLHELVPNTEVRFLAADRSTIAPTTQTATTSSGVALVGRDLGTGRINIGGRRSSESWSSIGCLLVPGFTFVEDKTVQSSAPGT